MSRKTCQKFFQNSGSESNPKNTLKVQIITEKVFCSAPRRFGKHFLKVSALSIGTSCSSILSLLFVKPSLQAHWCFLVCQCVSNVQTMWWRTHWSKSKFRLDFRVSSCSPSFHYKFNQRQKFSFSSFQHEWPLNTRNYCKVFLGKWVLRLTSLRLPTIGPCFLQTGVW